MVAGSINTNPIEQKIEIAGVPEVSPSTTQIIQTPKVQLNVLDFIPVIRNLRALNRAKKAKVLEPDTYFVPKGELVLKLRDSTDSLIFEKREQVTISSAVSWEKLVSNLDISQDGKLSVYIDNSSSDKVYFDNFEIERTEAAIAVVVQENHYYPFGMNMKGIEELDLQSLGNTDEHRFQYNGKEKEEYFGLNWTDYGWRNMDTQLGRFTKIDRFSEKYYSLSSYNYVANNPISSIDINGDSTHIVLYGAGYLNTTLQGQNHDVGNNFKKSAEAQAEKIRNSEGFDTERDAVIVAYAASTEQFMAAVNSEYESGKIATLTAYSHGSPNSVSLGGEAGNMEQKDNYDLREINSNTVSQMNKDNFETTARVFLNGCNIGNEWGGTSIAQEVANYLNVTVMAFDNYSEFKTKNGDGKTLNLNGEMIRSVDRKTQETKYTIFKKDTPPTSPSH